MRKKIMLCDKHGYTLFRCKRKCWNACDKFVSDYKEECFKCINEGIYIKIEIKKEKIKHFRI